MNRKLLDALLEYIDARFEELRARNSSDEGLSESLRARAFRDELVALVEPDGGGAK